MARFGFYNETDFGNEENLLDLTRNRLNFCPAERKWSETARADIFPNGVHHLSYSRIPPPDPDLPSHLNPDVQPILHFSTGRGSEVLKAVSLSLFQNIHWPLLANGCFVIRSG